MHHHLLFLLPQDANEALAEEKQRTDVLLARQLNLLSCALECNADATGTAAAASGGAGGGARRGGGEGEGGGEGGGGAWPAELIRLGSGSDIADSGPLKALGAALLLWVAFGLGGDSEGCRLCERTVLSCTRR
jgi:hypothetical protein